MDGNLIEGQGHCETMVDTDDIDALRDWLDGLPSSSSILGPKRGTPAVTPYPFDDEGNRITPAPEPTPAKGDPSRFYANVLTESVVEVPAGFNLTDEATSHAVLGVWA